MTVNYFHVLQAWFKFGDPSTLCFSGWFDLDGPKQRRVEILLDGKPLPYETEKYEDIAGRKWFRALGVPANVQYKLYVKIPEDLSGYKELVVQTVSDDEQENQVGVSIPVKKLQRFRKKIACSVDVMDFKEKKPVLRGWVLSQTPTSIRVTDKHGRDLPYTVAWEQRKDVYTSYREDGVELSCGFLLSLETPFRGKLTVHIKTGDGEAEYAYRCGARRIAWKFGRTKLAKAWKKFARVFTGHYPRQALQYIRRHGWLKFCKRVVQHLFFHRGFHANYNAWRLRHIPDAAQLMQQRNRVFSYAPRFSVVVPLYKTPENYLQKLIDSVCAQTYSNWELCLSDGSGADSPLTKFLQEVCAKEKRVKVVSSEKPLQISENTNAAIAVASGDFIVFADHDDELTPDALYECVRALNKNPAADLLYSDEDKISMDGKEYFQPHFKPDFSIDYLCSVNYFCHLTVIKKALLDRIGLLDPAYDGAQDYDMVLRASEQAQQIVHIPKVLYHWRAHQDSTAENPESKMYAFEAGARAIQAHYDRVGLPAEVRQGAFLGFYSTEFFLQSNPLVSILIPNKDHIDDLDKCLQSVLHKSTYQSYEILIIENNSTEPETFEYYKKMEAADSRIRTVYYDGDFNYSKINNFGARQAKGDYLLLLNNDTEVINPRWMEEMLGYCMRPDVGIVGAKLYYSDDTIQHGGVIVGLGGIAGHAFLGLRKGEPGYFGRAVCAQDVSAVTAACLMVKTKAFWEANGLTEELKVAFNDVDFCLKVRRCGYLVVFNPAVELYHYESKSRGYEDSPEKIARFQSEIRCFESYWEDFLEEGDPFYNENLSLMGESYTLR